MPTQWLSHGSTEVEKIKFVEMTHIGKRIEPIRNKKNRQSCCLQSVCRDVEHNLLLSVFFLAANRKIQSNRKVKSDGF